MTFETLKRSHLKRNILIAIGIVLILTAVILTFTRAKYRTTQSIPLIQGTINFSPSDFNMIAVYLNKGSETVSADKVPHVGYTLNEEQSTCESPDGVEDSIGIEYVQPSLTFSNVIKKGTKCSVYFDLIPDSEKPTINNIYSSSNDTSITITITASDNIGTFYYYFQLDNGNEVRTEENKYTFEGLEKDSVHTITVRVEDAAGNTSESSNKEITVGYKAGDIILATSTPQGETTDWTKGPTYYYTGNPNNWLQFAGFWWRIIRINGDGSIRMIYQGTSTNTSGSGTQIGAKAFNSSYNNNMYVGFKYANNQVHGTGINSTVLGEDESNDTTTLNGWYRANLLDYTDYIDGNAGFCGDRTPSTDSNNGNGSGGTGTTQTYYGAFIRIVSSNNPSLQCDSQDIYTTTDSSTGNKSLRHPIGLITADEAMLGGIPWNGTGTGSYLYTGQNYLTMSPYRFSSNFANIFIVANSGRLGSLYVNNGNPGVRPVINLRADVGLTGSGTTSDPFKVVL